MTTMISEPAPLMDRSSAANDCGMARTWRYREWDRMRRTNDYPRRMLGCGECSIAAKSGAAGITGHGPEMISGVRTQARDVRKDILVIVPRFGLVRRSVSVAGASSILKVHGGAQSVRINGSVESG